MKSLSDDLLYESYTKALEIKMDESFIKLLKEELKRRGLSLTQKTN